MATGVCSSTSIRCQPRRGRQLTPAPEDQWCTWAHLSQGHVQWHPWGAWKWPWREALHPSNWQTTDLGSFPREPANWHNTDQPIWWEEENNHRAPNQSLRNRGQKIGPSNPRGTPQHTQKAFNRITKAYSGIKGPPKIYPQGPTPKKLQIRRKRI